MTAIAFFEVCLNHTLNPEFTILYQFRDQKALFKVNAFLGRFAVELK